MAWSAPSDVISSEQPPRPGSVPVPGVVTPDQRYKVEGIVKNVTFHNEDNGYTVFTILSGLYETAVVGTTSGIFPGEKARCTGLWQTSPQYGRQLKADTIQMMEPDSREALLKYLSSGVIPGIGGHFAKTLIEHFGEKVFEVLDNEPHRLASLPGIGKKRLDSILESRTQQKEAREAMVFLLSHGLGGARAAKAYRRYRGRTVALLTENPYRMAIELHGFGFQVADEFARRLGFAATDPARIGAGLVYALEIAAKDGHCALLAQTLLHSAAKLLAVPADMLPTALAGELRAHRICQESWGSQLHYYLPILYTAEQQVSGHLRGLIQGPLPWTQAAAKDLPGILLSDSQKIAMEQVFQSKACVLTGGPGVGKTTLTRTLLARVHAAGARVALCAPTGKAAKRLSESTGFEAKTIHRLLEYNPMTGFTRNAEQPLEADLVIVDEMSMTDIELMASLLAAIPPAAGLWLVGDADQLPSVGPGAVLHDLMASGQLPVVRLTEIFRQAASSQIIQNAHKVLRGEIPVKQNPGEVTDFYLFTEEDPERIRPRLVDIVCQKIPAKFGLDPLQDVQVLTPMRKGDLGAEALAQTLQKALHPHAPIGITHGTTTFHLGDKVMQITNDYERGVFNGESGLVVETDLASKLLIVEFDGRRVLYPYSDLDELVLAYALTIHKSQGSEYPAIVIPLTTQHYNLLERNLLYTGITRGKQLVVLVGQARALAIAVKTQKAGTRTTTLAQRLKG